MDDSRIWAFERDLWTGDADTYRESIDENCLMIVPMPPYVMSGQQSVEAVSATPRWYDVRFSEQHVARPQDGLIVIAYKVMAMREGGDDFTAFCTTTYRRLAHGEWRVIQHQQLPPLTAAA